MGTGARPRLLAFRARVALLALAVLCLATASTTQATARDVWENLKARLAVSASQPASAPARAAVAEQVRVRLEACQKALEEHEDLLAEGDGLHYRGRIQELGLVGSEKAYESYRLHIVAAPEAPLAQDSRVFAARILFEFEPRSRLLS